jgi:uracil-DNA glycosylase
MDSQGWEYKLHGRGLCFVGQAPSRETEGKPPFVGKCGKFLAELLGTTQQQMLLDHDFVNVLDYYPGRGVGGDKFPRIEARNAAKHKLELIRGRIVILLGNNVARAFGAKSFEYGEWYMIKDDDGKVAVDRMSVIPHPSGINRYYNDPLNRAGVSQFLKGLARAIYR